MRVESFICDVCKNENGEIHLKELIDRQMDPSGNGYNNYYEYYDVCKYCIEKFIKENRDVEFV